MSPSTSFNPRATGSQLRLVRALTEAAGVSGAENAVRAIVRAEIEAVVDDLWTDGLGNLLALRRGRGRAPLKVMVAAHMDEVGFMITAIEPSGLLGFETVGFVDRQSVPGKAVWIGEGHHPGVIGVKPIHLSSAAERARRMEIESLRIDMAAGSAEAARKKVEPGDRVTFATPFRRIGPSIRAKALDDRLGVAALIELIQQAPDGIELQAAFTVQEEIGQSGARVAAQAFDPDMAVILDCTAARDLPGWDGSENRAYNAKVGAGPVIYAADGATVSDPRLFDLFTKTAEELGRTYQIRQPGRGKTDAAAIHLANRGIPSISISVPVRYMHGPAGIARISDWRSTVSLVHQVLSILRRSILKRR